MLKKRGDALMADEHDRHSQNELNLTDLISVIIPIYNMQDYLERCINSVIAQTYKNLQIILINDGSTDNSLEVCKKFAESDTRIEVIDKANGGLSDARNTGISQARGTYLSFVDSDDFVHERYIEKLYSCIKRDGSDMSVCGFCFVYESDVAEGAAALTEMTRGSPDACPDFAGLPEGVYDPATVMKTISATPLVVAWNKLYRRELFDHIRFPVGRLHEDEFVIHHLIDACDRISVTADNLYFYLQRAASITGARFTVRHLDVLDAYDERICYYLRNNTYELMKCTCLGYIRRYVEAYCKLPGDIPENILCRKQCKERFLTHRKEMFQYGGFSIGMRYLLAAASPKCYRAISELLHKF